MALIKGICKNFGECDLADNKEVQEVDKTNFVCEECGKPLHPVDGSGGGSKGPDDPSKRKIKLIAIIASAVLILAGVGYGIFSLTDNSNSKPTPIPGEDTTKNDTILAENITPESSAITLKEGEETKLNYSIIPNNCNETIDISSSNPEIASCEDGVIKGIKNGNAQIIIKASKSGKSATVNVTVNKKDDGTTNGGKAGKGDGGGTGPKVSWGKYEGPANGLGGTITVTRSYSLDLRNDGESLQLSPGDEIQQTKFKDGDLRGGVWVHNGSRRFFTR